MLSKTENDFLTNRDWLEAVVGGEDLVLCYTSALEYLELFCGYSGEKTIDVYAKQKGQFENINYHIVDTFDNIEVISSEKILCTSVNQTINDMLADYDNADELSLVEALSNYYFSHDQSFDGLIIKPKNTERFTYLKDWAMEYYCED